ncbi:MAG: hypothetical protein L7H10_00545 [Vulcanisaeta sp.]|nr:hypothetical protein [Vulcanisaeta sp.]MCG2869215.1 hypothetical protein [Vulcanisaeta sp.]MCG2886688.1 hypothetical protein [Vulcanisaeta sp.]
MWFVRSRVVSLILYYPATLIIVALGVIMAMVLPGQYAVIPEFVLSLIFIYVLARLRRGLGIGYSYIISVLAIILMGFASILVIRPEEILNTALSQMGRGVVEGFAYVIIYLFASLLPDSVTDLVGTLPMFILVTAIAVLELRLRDYLLLSIVTGVIGIGVSTVALSIIYRKLVVTYGLSAMTMGLMGSLLTASFMGMIKKPRKPMHLLNFLLTLYAVYESLWLLIPMPPILVMDGVGINRLGHFVSFAAGFIIAMFIT